MKVHLPLYGKNKQLKKIPVSPPDPKPPKVRSGQSRADCAKFLQSPLETVTQSVLLVYEGANSPFGATLKLNKHNEAEHNAWLQSLKIHNVLWNQEAIYRRSLLHRHATEKGKRIARIQINAHKRLLNRPASLSLLRQLCYLMLTHTHTHTDLI